MYINLTFMLQIGNFFLTYWFLNTYFFKPFLTVLEQKKYSEQSLKASLEQDESLLEGLKKEKEQRLIAFQNRIQSAYFVARNQNDIDTPLAELEAVHDDAVALFMYVRKSIAKACDGA